VNQEFCPPSLDNFDGTFAARLVNTGLPGVEKEAQLHLAWPMES
jgi:hypothetical protein